MRIATFPRSERTPVEIAASVDGLRDELAVAKKTRAQHVIVLTQELETLYSALDLLTIVVSMSRDALKDDGLGQDASGVIADCEVALSAVGVVVLP